MKYSRTAVPSSQVFSQLTALKDFEALFRTGNLAEAAREQNASELRIERSLRKLEAQFDISLVSGSIADKLEFTDDAANVYPATSNLFGAAELLEAALYKESTRRVARMSIDQFLPSKFVTNLNLDQLLENNIMLQTIEGTSEEVHQWFYGDNRNTKTALISLFLKSANDRTTTTKFGQLLDVEYKLYCRLDVTELLDSEEPLPVIMPIHGSVLRSHTMDILNGLGIRWRIATTATCLESAASFARAGWGACLLPIDDISQTAGLTSARFEKIGNSSVALKVAVLTRNLTLASPKPDSKAG